MVNQDIDVSRADSDNESFFDDWETILYCAVGCFFFAGMALFVGLITTFNGSSDESFTKGPGFLFLGICAPLTVLPGLVCLAIGLRGRRRAKRLEGLAGMLKAYRRIKISRIAAKLAVTELKAENLVVECLKAELLQGHIDRQTDEFFTQKAIDQRLHIGDCPKCGAPHDQVRLLGETAKCDSCGSLLTEPKSPSSPPE